MVGNWAIQAIPEDCRVIVVVYDEKIAEKMKRAGMSCLVSGDFFDSRENTVDQMPTQCWILYKPNQDPEDPAQYIELQEEICEAYREAMSEDRMTYVTNSPEFYKLPNQDQYKTAAIHRAFGLKPELQSD